MLSANYILLPIHPKMSEAVRPGGAAPLHSLGVFLLSRTSTGLKRICKARIQNRLNVPSGFLTLVTTLKPNKVDIQLARKCNADPGRGHNN